MMETECPSAYEEPKYIVFDSNLKLPTLLVSSEVGQSADTGEHTSWQSTAFCSSVFFRRILCKAGKDM
uniref:Uncharacterized protein n=1 Tax=Knipowitschia caucasica TaxID=637954 RepID=A0AAV2JXS8_KNICA